MRMGATLIRLGMAHRSGRGYQLRLGAHPIGQVRASSFRGPSALWRGETWRNSRMDRRLGGLPFAARWCAVLVVAASALAGTGPTVDVSGPVVYLPDGVELNGKKTPWRDLRSLEDV